MRARVLVLAKFFQLLACSNSRLSVLDCSKFHESCFDLFKSVMIWLKAKRLKHPYLWACQFFFNISTSNHLDALYILYFKNLITARVRENTRSACMLANYRKDNSIPLIVSLLDNHVIWLGYVMMTGLRRVLEYSAFTKISSWCFCWGRRRGGTVAFCTATCRTQVILSIPGILAFVVNMQGFGSLKHWV